MKIVGKKWGMEEIIVNNSLYCGKILYLKKGIKSSIHYHKEKDETFFVLEGEVILELFGGIYHELPDKTLILKKGDSHRLLPGQIHRFYTMNNKAKFLEISTHHSEEDTIRLKERKV